MCDQDISNGSRFAVLTTHSYSPYYSVRNFFIGFRIADACNIFLATIRNAAQIQLSLEMHWSLLQFDTLLKTILTTCSGAFTIISQGPYRFFYHPRTAMPSTSRKQSINGCSLPHTHGDGKSRYDKLLTINRVILIYMMEGERVNHARESRWLARDATASTSHSCARKHRSGIHHDTSGALPSFGIL
jgi:hypothetical protein